MNLKKVVKKTLGVSLAGAVVIGGGAVGVRQIRNGNGSTIDVYPVAELNAAAWIGTGDEEGVSGTVVSDVSQRVQVPDDKVIKEVYVEEGDAVKVGDKLLSYDTTLLELDQELQQLTVQKLQIEIKSAEADLEKLKNTTPIVRAASDDDDESYSTAGDDALLDSLEDMEDSGFDEARVVDREGSMLASSEEKDTAGTEATADTVAAAEPDPETEAKQTEATENAVESETEAGASEESPSEEKASDENQESDKEKDTQGNKEIILDGQTDVIGADQLGGNEQSEQPDSSDVFDIIQDMKDQNQSEKNVSLKPFLSNIRMKAVTEDGEVLLADTAADDDITVEVTGKVKLIPHFKETEKDRFDVNNTYQMLIKGLSLKTGLKGKVYGIAEINGDDYPEIGGYTLVQKDEDTAVLTIAYHDGLAKEHEIDQVLDDSYVEIALEQEELKAGDLVFITGDTEQDQKRISILKAEEEMLPELQETEYAADDSDVQSQETENQGTAALEETEQTVVEDTESEEMTEETETETESDADVQPEKKDSVYIDVKWEHGTNHRLNWPEALKLYFYASENDDAEWTVSFADGKIIRDDADGEAGDTQPETEDSETASAQAASSENGDKEATGYSEAAETGTTGTGESGSYEEGATDKITDTEDQFGSENEQWDGILLKWPQSSSFKVGEEAKVWAYAPDYVSVVTYDSVSNTYHITMKYQEPVDSPEMLFTPFNKLTYENGVNSVNESGPRAYKGSGTADDPYVFLVSDGVMIESSFVNWVLGFNSDGTERISDGYVVRLEIREADSITGAFLRSVELDGTVFTEIGYGPGTYWIFSSENGIQKYEEEVPDEGGSDTPGGGGADWSDDGTGYTAEELEAAIKEKELELRGLRLDEREAQLKLKKYNDEMDNSTVVSAVNGVVTSVDDGSDDAYLVVNSAEGLYVKTTIDELNLQDTSVDEIINCQSWDSGTSFEARITQIDYVPTTNDDSYYFYSTGNVNSSNYPVLAIVEGDVELSEYESISVTYPSNGKSRGRIYLEKAYIRSENGKSYVYVKDENGKLKKQYVRTGTNSYGYIEIKSGLNSDDEIAFPYGKKVKEGAKARLSSEYED